jgi:hypothetical protein
MWIVNSFSEIASSRMNLSAFDPQKSADVVRESSRSTKARNSSGVRHTSSSFWTDAASNSGGMRS